MAKYSIILPVYNGGDYVKQCIQSILLQTLPEFELLILENNSNDGTLQYVQSLNDPRIKIFSSSITLGIVESWGRIKDLPKNEFITLIGHDDLLKPGYLEQMDKLIHKHPQASLYQTHFDFIDSDGKVLRPCIPMAETQYGEEFLACQLTHKIDSMGTGYMMRSKDFDALGGMPLQYPNLIFADYQLWVQLSLKSFKATSPEVCFLYRLHASTSRLTNGEQYQQALAQYVFFISRLMKENENIRKVVAAHGHDYLLFFCESLSHRILKTPSKFRKTSVADFINKCIEYAALWNPGQEFKPLNKIRIRLAKDLDSSAITRSAFQFYKKLTRKF